MLSRIANSLFWLGRYLERTEHLARYTKVHYFSALDAPQKNNKEDLLNSILKNAGLNYLYFKDYPTINEQAVIFYVALDYKNPFSIASTINQARENARGARDAITTELWVAINQYYHTVNEYALTPFDPDDTFDLTQSMINHCNIIKGLIDNTLLHNDAWHLISLGIHIERAIQIMRIIITKTDDIANLEKTVINNSIANYHWSILLKSAESYDMCNRYYRATPSRSNVLEFLILNPQFPKSILFNLSKAFKHFEKVTAFKLNSEDKFMFNAGKLLYSFKYLTINEIQEKDVNTFMNNSLNTIYNIAADFERQYLLF
jgi:uncharacterized alpha-E superfamily protein